MNARVWSLLAAGAAAVLGVASFVSPRVAFVAALFAFAAMLREAFKAGGRGRDWIS